MLDEQGNRNNFFPFALVNRLHKRRMDKARYFEYVYRLPEANRDQLGGLRSLCDEEEEQLLQQKSMSSGLRRLGRSASRESRREFLEDSNQKSEAQQRISNAVKLKRKEKSNSVVAHLMNYQDEIDKTRTPCRHNLYVDFQALQQERFRRAREIVELEEYFLRTKIELWEDCQTFLLDCAMRWSCEIHDFAAQKRRIRLEEQRKREEEAEKQRREQAEIDKRLERKKREEMRRAKQKAERQRQQHGGFPDEAEAPVPESGKSVEADPEPPTPAPPQTEPSPEPPIEPEQQPTVVPEPETTPEPEVEQRQIQFANLEGDNIVALMNSATSILSSAGDHSYSVRMEFFAAAVEQANAPLLGRKIVSETSVSVSSEMLHGNISEELEDYLSRNVERIVDVRSDERCMLFREGIEKTEETLVLFPVALPNTSHSPFVVALCREGRDSISPQEIELTGKLVLDLMQRLKEMYRRMFLHQLCQQCVDWLSLCMGCENVYISLATEGSTDDLTYVAATASHRFMLGMRHSRVDENAGNGISHKAMDLSIPEKRCKVTHFPDVSLPSDGPLQPENIRFFQEANRKGPLMIAPITGCKDDSGVSLGCVFMDRLGSKQKKFSAVDEEVMRMATQMLADIMLGNIPLDSATHLKIEEEVDASSLTFLKIMWDKCVQNLGNISNDQLLELAKYREPPPVIPTVVQSTLLVALRCKPSKIKDWKDARIKVTQKLLTRMAKLDPTNATVTKNSFFVRARKLVKGLTAEDVFSKGSYPTQCFFNWVFAAILLRKHSVALRKRIKSGGMTDFEETQFPWVLLIRTLKRLNRMTKMGNLMIETKEREKAKILMKSTMLILQKDCCYCYFSCVSIFPFLLIFGRGAWSERRLWKSSFEPKPYIFACMNFRSVLRSSRFAALFSLLWKDELSAGSSSVIQRCGLSTRGEESTDFSSTHHHCIGAQWNKHDTFQSYHVREMIIINCFAFHGFCYFCQRNCGVSITLMTIRQLVNPSF
eukprot:gene59-37_t